MDVTLFYFEDCPSWQEASIHLETLAEESSSLVIHYQVVDTDEAAQQHRFCGSPSIHANGHDVFADPGAPVGLSCRIYQTPDGPAGSPTLGQLRRALSTSASGRSTFTTSTARDPAVESTRHHVAHSTGDPHDL